MTLYSKNSWGPAITDHHDVTEEDVRAANWGDDEEGFWGDFYRPKPSFKGRSPEWIRQYNASRMRGPQ